MSSGPCTHASIYLSTCTYTNIHIHTKNEREEAHLCLALSVLESYYYFHFFNRYRATQVIPPGVSLGRLHLLGNYSFDNNCVSIVVHGLSFQRLIQENQKFEASLSYIVSSQTAWTTIVRLLNKIKPPKYISRKFQTNFF